MKNLLAPVVEPADVPWPVEVTNCVVVVGSTTVVESGSVTVVLTGDTLVTASVDGLLDAITSAAVAEVTERAVVGAADSVVLVCDAVDVLVGCVSEGVTSDVGDDDIDVVGFGVEEAVDATELVGITTVDVTSPDVEMNGDVPDVVDSFSASEVKPAVVP